MSRYANVEKLLYDYKIIEASIVNMKSQLEILKAEDGMAAINYGGVSTSPTNETKSATENQALKNIELEKQLKCKIKKQEAIIAAIDRSLLTLKPVKQQIIKERYIKGRQWWQVANVVCYSESWCKQLNKKAIKKIVVGLYGE